MASITSLSNSYNTSSIYGNRNVLSGLASGMDTEQMIENAISGIKTKIQNLYKKRTKIEWQQEAYRSIIDKAVNFNTKYTSYSSKTNLLSSSFFSNAVNTVTKGTYADKITASGKTSSDVKINAVKQLATAAAYTCSGLGGQSAGELSRINAGEGFDITGKTTVSTVSGRLSFQYGGTNGTTFDIKFDELENINDVKVYNADGTEKTDATNAEKLAQAIQNKLDDITYSYTKNGVQETTTAGKAIKVEADPIFGSISFSDGLGEGNTVKINYVSGDIEDTLGVKTGDTSLRAWQSLSKEVDTKDYLADKELGITFNGVTKKISMSKVLEQTNLDKTYDNDPNESFKNALQSELDKAFGSGKITVNQTPVQDDGTGGQLSFSTASGATLSLGGTAIEGLGFEDGDSNFINQKKKLTDILGEDFFKNAPRLKGEFDEGAKPIPSKNGTYYLDSKGNRVDEEGYRVTAEGKAIYDFRVNDAQIQLTEDSTLESLMNSINSNASAGVKVSYSQLTNEFKFTATETGANGRIEFGGLAKELFVSGDHSADDSFAETYGFGMSDGESKRIAFGFDSYDLSFVISSDDTIQDIADYLNESIYNDGWTASYDELSGQLKITDKTGKAVDFDLYEGDDSKGTKIDIPEFASSYSGGQDAVLDVEINGKHFDNLTRSSNSFDIDGLTVNVKGTFDTTPKDGEAYEPVTFETTTDADKIVDAIRDFVDDYNEMITEIKNAYSTTPAEKTNGARYEPLTAEQEEGMTESELKAYEEKAKQGILFADSTLSSMYSRLLNAIQPGGTDGQILREIGIGTSYSSGLTTISLDEDKLRNALESDPDKVKNAFTKTREGGSSTDGLMQTLQNNLNTYTKTTGEPKGVLIQRAGSVKAPTSLNSNSLKSQMDSIDNQIERWQNKMSDQIDRYTTQFSRLEQLIAEMNSQASAFSGLMGGSSGY